MVNYLSIDFESWTYPNLPNFRTLNSQQRKKLDNGYVKESVEKILRILKSHQVKITFFVVSQLYDWYPEEIEKIAHEGHEIAYHTHTHDILKTKEDLINTLKKSKKFLQRFKPLGFRAPTFLIREDYFPILRDYGFKYDSSVYDDYSLKKVIDGVVEIPVSKMLNLPIGSGYFAAVLGKKIKKFYQRINQQRKPVVSFVHNWQIIKPKNASFPDWRFVLKHPLYFPYTLSIYQNFNFLLENFSFAPMKNLIKGS